MAALAMATVLATPSAWAADAPRTSDVATTATVTGGVTTQADGGPVMTPDGPLIELTPEPNLTQGYAGSGVSGDPLSDGYSDEYLRLTYGLGVYLNVTGLEAKAVASALVSAGGFAYVYTCEALGGWRAVSMRNCTG